VNKGGITETVSEEKEIKLVIPLLLKENIMYAIRYVYICVCMHTHTHTQSKSSIFEGCTYIDSTNHKSKIFSRTGYGSSDL
jgi:hypothetical protein